MQEIRLNQRNKTIKIVNRKENISLRRTGSAGPEGPPGLGLLPGGNTGDIIVKASDDDYDYELVSPNALADKNYKQDFVSSTSVTVSHNLNKYPSVSIFDTAGDEVEGTVTHQDLNSLVLNFSAPFSGQVTCN